MSGRWESALWRLWRGMLARCDDPSKPRYGGRGIAVCARWRSDFDAFADDLGIRGEDTTLSLDRIDNDGGYWCGAKECSECGPLNRTRNVRWATPTQQARNTSVNRRVTALGETLCLAAWTERWGVPAGTIAKRLDAGWPADSAVSTPTT